MESLKCPSDVITMKRGSHTKVQFSQIDKTRNETESLGTYTKGYYRQKLTFIANLVNINFILASLPRILTEVKL